MDDVFFWRDVNELAASAEIEALANKTVFITGSTGMIGSLLVRGILAGNETYGYGVRVIALARNCKRAERALADLGRRDDFSVVCGSVIDLPPIEDTIDFIWHGASITSSRLFVSNPVEVVRTELGGMVSVLELARDKSVSGLVYLSSLEVYGELLESGFDVTEVVQGPLDHMSPRNSYPMAKRMAECLCASYAAEYGVPAKIGRLAQTFGAGAALDDGRVYADFAKRVIGGVDIVLHTSGEGSRTYCYTTDAVRGLLAVLVRGGAGEAYNVSNPETYCSFREMAESVVNWFPESGSHLSFDRPEDLKAFGYAAPSHLRLSSEKLMGLGWSPRVGLREMYRRLIGSMRCRMVSGLDVCLERY